LNRVRFRWWPIFLWPTAIVPCAFGAAGDNIFAGLQVHTVAIDFAQPAYWDSLTHYYDEGLEQYMAARVTVDGVPYDSVGVRLKGNASYTHPNQKKPFRLSFDEYRSAQRWDGLKGVHLNNCWEDPTFIREKLHLDYCRDAGIPAPRGNFAALTLNGELWGFYSLVEHVDGTFLTTRYGNNDGNLYKAVDGFLNPMISDFRWYGSDPSAYYNRYELRTDNSPNPWTDLIAVIDQLNNSPNPATALPPLVNLESVYRALATDNLLASFDSYAGSGRNFYCYFNETNGKMEWIVWDAGMSIGSFWGSTTNYETASITFVSNATNRPLASKIFGTPALRQQYYQTYGALFTAYFTTANLYPRIDAIANLIRPHVYADPRKMYTNTQFEQNIDSDIVVGGHRKPGLKAFIPLRAASVSAQLSVVGVPPAEGPPASPALALAMPNPFPRGSKIEYGIVTPGPAALQVFDSQGRLSATLVEREHAPGAYRTEFTAEGLPSGVYFCRLESQGAVAVRKLLIVD
jgi:spore coat protein CotH